MELDVERIVVAGANVPLGTDDLAMVEEDAVERAIDFLEAIDHHAARARAAIATRTDSRNDLTAYHARRMDEIGADVAGRDPAECAAKLTPVAVWFGLDEDGGDWEAMIDYSLGENVTDALISARMNADGEVLGVMLEG